MTIPVTEVAPEATTKLSYMPKATAYRMTGDYSNNVAVTYAADGRLLYYPAPSDITANSKPTDLGNGWWLNNQGLSANSQFTKWTYDEYAALEKTPTADEIKAALIPGAKVAEICVLPYKASEARSRVAELKKYLSDK